MLQRKPWPLEFIENPAVSFSWRVEWMRLNKEKTALTVNKSLTLAGIPPEAFGYQLGNRSAIVRLVGQVVRVSLETVRLVKSLPERYA